MITPVLTHWGVGFTNDRTSNNSSSGSLPPLLESVGVLLFMTRAESMVLLKPLIVGSARRSIGQYWGVPRPHHVPPGHCGLCPAEARPLGGQT